MADLHSRSKDRTISRYPRTGCTCASHNLWWHRATHSPADHPTFVPSVLLPQPVFLPSLPFAWPVVSPDKIANRHCRDCATVNNTCFGHHLSIHTCIHSVRTAVAIQSNDINVDRLGGSRAAGRLGNTFRLHSIDREIISRTYMRNPRQSGNVTKGTIRGLIYTIVQFFLPTRWRMLRLSCSWNHFGFQISSLDPCGYLNQFPTW